MSIASLSNPKKVITASYNFLFAASHGLVEPNFNRYVQNERLLYDSLTIRLIEFYQRYEKVLGTIQESFNNISSFIVAQLQSLSMGFSRNGFVGAEQMRKDGTLNATLNVKTAALDDGVSRISYFITNHFFRSFGRFLCTTNIVRSSQ
jgi:hypothetical protein